MSPEELGQIAFDAVKFAEVVVKLSSAHKVQDGVTLTADEVDRLVDGIKLLALKEKRATDA